MYDTKTLQNRWVCRSSNVLDSSNNCYIRKALRPCFKRFGNK